MAKKKTASPKGIRNILALSICIVLSLLFLIHPISVSAEATSNKVVGFVEGEKREEEKGQEEKKEGEKKNIWKKLPQTGQSDPLLQVFMGAGLLTMVVIYFSITPSKKAMNQETIMRVASISEEAK